MTRKVRFGDEWVNVGGSGLVAPLLHVDSLALHSTVGDDFDGPSLDAAWTLQGITGGALSFIVPTSYDDSALQVVWPNGASVIHRAKPAATNFTIYGTYHGCSALGGMEGLCITDNSGNGVGFSPYSGGASYIWGLSGWAYSASGNSVAGVPWRYPNSGVPYILRIVKSGTSYTGGYSSDGGLTWLETASGTNSTTMTRVGFGKFFSGTPTQKIGRFNAVDA